MAKQLPLSEFHKSNGAAFGERDSWSVPLHFGNPQAEYDAVRHHVGLMDFSDRGFLEFTGPDRASYLQGMISNDLRNLLPGQGLYATLLNVQGKVLGDTRVFCTADSFLLDLWEPIKEKILNHLNRYLVADEVEITDLTEQYGLISAQGPKSAAFLQQLVEPSALPQRPFDHSVVQIDGAQVRIVRYSHSGHAGFDLFIPKGDLTHLAQWMTDIGRGYRARWVGEQVQEVLRVEAGIPRYGIDFNEDHLLLETGLDHAVSFTKGCYLGQEVVERIHSRGHVNKKLTGLLLEGQTEAKSGNRITSANKEVGIITSSVNSPTLKRGIAMGYLHHDFWSPGTAVEVVRDGSVIPARVTSLPFVRWETDRA
ncbi:MAG TPA: aminomethyltransferase family protein [Candidatus Binatia bacterium]|nr:aminomethyltransferase family protein [Candidatus Binatia bacterium]